MKANRKMALLLWGGLVGMFFFSGVAKAQHSNGIPQGQGEAMPESITSLMWSGDISKAFDIIDSLKSARNKKDLYDVLSWELMLYDIAQTRVPEKASVYKEKYEALVQQMISAYPDKSDTYLLQIRPESTPEEIVELATKAIKADPNNLRAYEFRGQAYSKMGKTAEAEADMRKFRGL